MSNYHCSIMSTNLCSIMSTYHCSIVSTYHCSIVSTIILLSNEHLLLRSNVHLLLRSNVHLSRSAMSTYLAQFWALTLHFEEILHFCLLFLQNDGFPPSTSVSIIFKFSLCKTFGYFTNCTVKLFLN